MMNARRLIQLLSLSAVFLASGLPMTGCCGGVTLEISTGLAISFPNRELERRVAVRALGDRVRLEFSEPILATLYPSGQRLEPCSETNSPVPSDGPIDEDPPGTDDPDDEVPPVGEGGAGGQSGPGGAAGAGMTPVAPGGAAAWGGQGGMSSDDPPTVNPPTVNPPTVNPPPGGVDDGYVTCVQIVGFNLREVVQLTRRGDRSFEEFVSIQATAIDEVDGCGWNEPTQGIVLEPAD